MLKKMAEIVKQTKELEKLVKEIEIIPNRIWVPHVGLVKLWEIKKQNG